MGSKIGLVFALLCFTEVLCAPTGPENLVVSSTEPAKESSSEGKKESGPIKPEIYGFKVDTNVTNRFATTVVTSKVKNAAETAQEATFSVVLPETAYISGFVMEIDGKSYKAYVKEKEEAKKIYDEAVSSGLGAAHVAVKARDSNRFTVSVNIQPESKATFFLTYEELLQRQNGQYDIVINIHPGQPVKDLDVQVNINETRPLKFVKAPALRSGNEISKNEEKLDPKAQIEIFNATTAKVKFNPDLNRQKQLALDLGAKEDIGLSGQFVVQYDVERDSQGGEILVSDGYFVHFFAPSDLTPLKKRIIFVLDTSGSMWGTRIIQMKEAMKSILAQLNEGDTFNIVDFNSAVKVWDIPNVEIVYTEGTVYDYSPHLQQGSNKTNQILPDAFDVNEINIRQAQKVLDSLSATGGTNIDAAIKVSLDLISKGDANLTQTNQPIIIFLTDGSATSGETDNDVILAKISEHNIRQVPIFALSFGDGADRSFLEKISIRNHGFARHIYEAADASLQLEAFYSYISSPLLSNVHFKYVAETVSKVTKTIFPILFHGSEIAVCGVLNRDGSRTPLDSGFAPPIVTGWGHRGQIILKPVIENPVGSLEKHWAYLTVKQLLDEREAADNNKTEYTKKVLDVALKYSFVTPVSSLVVVKPNDTKSETGTEDASKQGQRGTIRRKGAHHGGVSLNRAPGIQYPAQSLPIPQGLPPRQSFTTVRPMYLSTSASETLTLLKLKVFLPWLHFHLDDNGDLKLPTGSFKLGINNHPKITSHPVCSETPKNSTGVCTLLEECNDVFIDLIDFKIYTKYFCPLGDYAGVCCPEKIKSSPL